VRTGGRDAFGARLHPRERGDPETNAAGGVTIAWPA
jgi:hypothetical protein